MIKRPKIGAMRHKVDIQSQASGLDAAGQPNGAWSNLLSDVPANVHTIRGAEGFRGRQVDARSTHVIETRWNNSVTIEHRVSYNPEGQGPQTLNIIAINDVDGRQRYMVLDCMEAV